MKTAYRLEQSHTRPFEYRIINTGALVATVPLLSSVDGMTRDEANELPVNWAAQHEAERIVATLNAAQGVPTEKLLTLTEHGGGMIGLSRTLMAIRGQYAALGATMLTFREILSAPEDPNETQGQRVAAIIQAIDNFDLRSKPAIASLLAEADAAFAKEVRGHG